MIRNVVTRASSLFLPLALLTVAGCCHEQQPAVMLPPVENREQKIAALEAQLKAAETSGWGNAEERRFSSSMSTLPMDVRIDYAQRLARALTFNQIRVRRPPPRPANAPICACGGNSCGVTPVPAPVNNPAQDGAPPATTGPARTK